MTETSLSPFISAHDLEGLRSNKAVKVFDVRGKWGSDAAAAKSEYDAGHIPDAVLLDWREHFIEHNKPLNLASVASPEEAKASFAALGISDGDHVVLYDNYHHMLAGRMWWAMQHLGFSDVQILEGGWKYWITQGGDVSTISSHPTTGSFQPTIASGFRVTLSDFLAQKETINLIDGRGMAGYLGKPEDPRTGHIPGAINIPYLDLLDEDTGLLKSDQDLRDIFTRKLPDFPNKPITSSCGSGYSGTIPLLALRKIGIEVPLYDGSFAEWKSDPNRPVEQGQKPTT